MNLCNVTKADFVELFGEASFELISQYEVDVYLVDNESAEFTMIGQNLASVYENEGRLLAIFNVERINAVLEPIERLITARGQHKRSGTVVHECVHLQQMKEGRLAFADGEDGGCYWEDTYYARATVYGDYFNSPWEHEAFVAEMMYVMHMGVEEATSIVNKFIAGQQLEAKQG